MKRNGNFRKVLLFFLVIGLVMCQVIPERTNRILAESTDSGELSVVPDKPVDIVLSVGSSYLGLDSFESDLKDALQKSNVNMDKVNIKTFDSIEISSESQDAYKIFITWRSFPFNSSIYWRYDGTNRWLTTSYNEAYETGFIDQNNGYVKDFSMSANIQGPETCQPLGFVFRVQPSVSKPGKWDMYYLWVSADTWTNGGNEKVFAIFKVEGQNLDASSRPNLAGTYSATPLMRYAKNYFGWPYHYPNDYGGYPHGTPYKTGITVTNKVDLNMKTKTIAIGSIPAIDGNSWYDLNLNVNGNHFTASVNNQQVLDVTDEDNPYTEGYYGIFSYSHINPKFRNIMINQRHYKSLSQTLDETQWRDDSTKIVINLNDKLEEAFSDDAGRLAMLKKMREKNIFYVGWGNEVNWEQNETFIKENDGQGIVIGNGNYEEAIQKIASYVVLRSRFSKGSGTKEDPYIITSKEQLSSIKYYKDSYFRLETDINLKGYSWTPIGTESEPFTGYFDGDGHIISNVTVLGDETGAAGFFGVINNGIVRNVTMHQVSIRGGSFTGGVAGIIKGSSSYIEDCYIEEGTIEGTEYIGGIAGKIEGGTVCTCEITVDIYGRCYIGGIAGLMTGTVIKGCISYATVTGVEKCGGIIGSGIGIRMEDCQSYATVTGNSMIGGISGYNYGKAESDIGYVPCIVNCQSYATVKGETLAEAIIGLAEETDFKDCFEMATVEKSV